MPSLSEPSTTAIDFTPLAHAQRGLWVGETIGPPDTIYWLGEYTEIIGPLCVPSMLRALERVVAEAETTRMQIVTTRDGPRIEILDRYPGTIDEIDFTAADDPEAAAIHWMQAELRRPTRLDRDPLWRSHILRVGPERRFWLQAGHHIVLDGFSASLISRRVHTCYEAFIKGEQPPPSPFEPLSRQIEIERQYRDSPRRERDRRYWLEQFAAVPEPPTLSQRRGIRRAGGLLRHRLSIDAERSSRLHELAATIGCGFPALMTTLIASFLRRALDVDELVLGMPVTGRSGALAKRVPGLFANVVGLRIDFVDDETLAARALRVAAILRGALRHQQYRYEDLRRDLGLIAQDQQIAWLGVNIEPFLSPATFGDCRAVTHNLSNGTIEDLTFFVYDRGPGGCIEIDLDTNPAMYSRDELSMHAGRLERLIAALEHDAEGCPDAVDLLSDADRLVLQRGTPPAGKTPPDWLETLVQRARDHPHDTAIEDQHGSCEYAELIQHSETLAAELVAAGVQPGDCVALRLPRDRYLPIALLAVARAGALFLPLDPETPAAREADILADSSPTILLTRRTQKTLPTTGDAATDSDGALESPAPSAFRTDRPSPPGVQPGTVSATTSGTLPDGAATREIDIDDLLGQMPQPSPVPHRQPATEDSTPLAYRLYTSGSTGRPKGVDVPHTALSNLLHGMIQRVGLDRDTRLLALTTACFDIALFELLGPLMAGGRVVVAPEAVVRDPREQVRWIEKCGINVLQATPSSWQGLAALEAPVLNRVTALVGGEPLTPLLAHRLLNQVATLWNCYGPTETTIWTTLAQIDAQRATQPDIGEALANQRVYVLDRRLRPVPPEVTGVLWIAGAGVAAGYHRRPELTRERFVPDPFQTRDVAGQMTTMYATGDRARWTRDGRLLCLGRSDDQIKIRGYRIEPGEIETCLEAQDGVERACVLATPHPGGETALIAYVQGSAGTDSEGLRNALASTLPAAMLPSRFIALDAFPLTSNGKIDRRALPAPEWTASTVTAPLDEAPRTDRERELAAIWCRILGIERIGIHESFFALGGDSLSAVRLALEIEESLGRNMPLEALFEAQTIATLAQKLDAPRTQPLGPVLQIGSGESMLFALPPLSGVVWGFAGLVPLLHPPRTLVGLQAPSLSTDEALPTSIAALARQCRERIRELNHDQPLQLIGWSFGGLVAHEIARQAEQEGEPVESLVLLDTWPGACLDELPHAESATDEPMNEARFALAFLGIPEPADREIATIDEFIEHLAEHFGAHQHPLVRGLKLDSKDLLERLRRTLHHHLTLWRQHEPGRVAVDTLFVQAQHAHTAIPSSVFDPLRWKRHVTGHFDLVTIESGHQEMLDPGSVEALAELLNPWLASRKPLTAA